MSDGTWVEGTVHGRLQAAYPAGRHDLELRVDAVPTAKLTAVLREQAGTLMAADAALRKVIVAVPAQDLTRMAAVEDAGFRYVVDVDVLEAGTPIELALLVREPESVTRVDMDLDRVPGA